VLGIVNGTDYQATFLNTFVMSVLIGSTVSATLGERRKLLGLLVTASTYSLACAAGRFAQRSPDGFVYVYGPLRVSLGVNKNSGSAITKRARALS
jgi:hypothetical protein